MVSFALTANASTELFVVILKTTVVTVRTRTLVQKSATTT